MLVDIFYMTFYSVVVVVDIKNFKNGRKPEKLQKESPAGCAGEGKQSEGNIGKEERTLGVANFCR